MTSFEKNLQQLLPSLALNEKIVSSETPSWISSILKENTCSEEENNTKMSFIGHRYDHITSTELYLHRKTLVLESYEKLIRTIQLNDEQIFEISNDEDQSEKEAKFQWVESIQEKLLKIEEENNPELRIWLVTNSINSGILGMFNSLRLESNLKIRVLINQTGSLISADTLTSSSTPAVSLPGTSPICR